MNKVFSSLFNLNSSFIAIYSYSLFIFSLIWIKLSKSYGRHKKSYFRTFLLIISTIFENLFFIFAAKEQPSFYFGFWITEFSSILLFYLSLVLIFVQFIKSIVTGFSTSNFISKFSYCLLFLSIFQLSYVIAFGSPLTFIFWLISLIMQFIKFIFAQKSIKESEKDITKLKTD